MQNDCLSFLSNLYQFYCHFFLFFFLYFLACLFSLSLNIYRLLIIWNRLLPSLWLCYKRRYVKKFARFVRILIVFYFPPLPCLLISHLSFTWFKPVSMSSIKKASRLFPRNIWLTFVFFFSLPTKSNFKWNHLWKRYA